MTNSNPKKQVWILYTRKILNGKMAAVPIKAFTSKELCFFHCQGDWQSQGNNHYVLNFNSPIGNVVKVQGFYTHPIDFYDESDVPE